MKIEVTQDDINNGQRSRCRFCPVALAIQRTFPDQLVTVGNEAAEIGMCFITFPTNASEFISAFDKGLKVQPFTFEINERRIISG